MAVQYCRHKKYLKKYYFVSKIYFFKEDKKAIYFSNLKFRQKIAIQSLSINSKSGIYVMNCLHNILLWDPFFCILLKLVKSYIYGIIELN